MGQHVAATIKRNAVVTAFAVPKQYTTHSSASNQGQSDRDGQLRAEIIKGIGVARSHSTQWVGSQADAVSVVLPS